jgi:hypothetical protein
MSTFEIHQGDKVAFFDEAGVFLTAVDSLLQLGQRFTIVVARSASEVFEEINAIFAQHDIQIALLADSDPDAAEYVVNALAAGLLGAAGGAALGAGVWLGLARAAAQGLLRTIPGVGQVLMVTTIAGVVIGALAGGVVTKWGLKVRFVPLGEQEGIEIEFRELPPDE